MQIFAPRREPMFFVPRSVRWLLVALVAAHVGRMFLSADAAQEAMIRFAFMPIRYAPGIYGGSLLDKIAPFFTHQFLHAGWVHLGMNAVWLLACGPAVARRFGGWLFWAFFLICGALGAAFFLACDWGGIDGMIGASGAVSGLMAAAVRMVPPRGLRVSAWAREEGLGMPLAPLFSRSVMVFGGIWFATNLLFGLTGFGAGGEIHQIAWQAHIGGFLGGLILVDPFEAWCRRRRKGCRKG